jgi:hypothetical protein
VWLRSELGAAVQWQQACQHAKSIYKQSDTEIACYSKGKKQAKTSPDDDIKSDGFKEYSYKTKR